MVSICKEFILCLFFRQDSEKIISLILVNKRMSEFEKNLPVDTSDEKPELGSLAIDDEGHRKIRKDIFAQEAIDSESTYRKDKDREKAIADVISIWTENIPKAEVSQIVIGALINPELYKKFIDEQIKTEPSDELEMVLRYNIEGFKKFGDYINELKETMIKERVEYNDLPDIDLNIDFKDRIEKTIIGWEKMLERSEELISYSEEKINELI